jgi:hypothetical protein
VKKFIVSASIFLFAGFFLFAADAPAQKEEEKKDEKSSSGWFGEPEPAMLELGLGFFYHTYHFETQDDDAGNAAHINYRKDLGYDKAYLHFDADFAFRFKKFKLSAGYTMLNAVSKKAAGRELTFYDAIFNMGEDMKSTFNVHLIKLDFTWYILDLNAGKNLNFKLGPSIRIDMFVTDIRLESTDDKNKKDKFSAPLVPFPSLGISFETTIFKYSGIFFDINGMYAGKYLGFMDLKSGIRVYPWHWTGIEFAYRHLLAKALWQGDGVETEFKGFNMSFILRF